MRKDEAIIGKRIKKLRLDLGYSTKELAEMTHISEKRLISLEAGNMNTIKLSEIMKIADAEGVSIKKMFSSE